MEGCCAAWGGATYPQERRAESGSAGQIRRHREGPRRSRCRCSACSNANHDCGTRQSRQWRPRTINARSWRQRPCAYRHPRGRKAADPSVLETLLSLLLLILLLLLLRKWNESNENEIHSEVQEVDPVSKAAGRFWRQRSSWRIDKAVCSLTRSYTGLERMQDQPRFQLNYSEWSGVLHSSTVLHLLAWWDRRGRWSG